MHIGYVLKEFPKISETFIARELLELERLGFDVTVLALREARRPARHGWLDKLRAEVVPCGRGSTFSSTWKALKQQARARPDRADGIGAAIAQAFACPWRSGRSYLTEAAAIAAVVDERRIEHLHAHFANHPTYVAMLAHLVSGAPYSFTAHAKDIYAGPLSPAVWRDQVGAARFAVTVSEATREHVAGLVGDDLKGKVRRLYNGVDLDAIRPDSAARGGALEVVFVGRLIEKKGADVLIDAAKVLADHRVDARFTIVGDGALDGELRARAAVSSLDRRIDFTGALSHEAVIEKLRRSDVIVLPSRVAADGDRDALPTVLLEGMAAGVPAISTPINGIPEIVAHGVNGFLVPENHPRRTAAAIATLAENPLLRQRMSLAARRRAESRFDARRNVACLAGWFSHGRRAERRFHSARGGAVSPAGDARRLAR